MSDNLPPSRIIDLGRARVDGTRLRRRRRATQTAVSATTALAVATGITFAIVAIAEPVRPARLASPPATHSLAVTPTPTPTQFDILRLRLTAGWLPAVLTNASSIVERSEETDQYRQILDFVHMIASPQVAGTWGGDQEVRITASVVGITPAPLTPATAVGPAPSGTEETTVGALPARWYPAEQTLVWEWSPGAYATVQATGDFGDSDLDVARHVASTLRTDDDRPVRMPFTMGAPPPQVPLVQTIVTWPTPINGYQVQVNFSDQRELPGSDTRFSHVLAVAVMPGPATPGRKYAQPNTSIAGQPANLTVGTGQYDLTLYDRTGAVVSVSVDNPITLDVVGSDALTALAATIRVVPGSTDPTTWQASLFR
jgi:hypothetical protein